MTTTLEHLDALRDVFADVTQDCLMLDLKPYMVQVSASHVSVQFTGTDVRAVNALADAWGLDAPRVIGGGTYLRDGRAELHGGLIAQVFTGHPGGPIVPADYAPQAVEA